MTSQLIKEMNKMKKKCMNGIGLITGSMLVSSTLAMAAPSVEVTGLVEVEAYTTEDFAKDKTTEIELATVEIGFDAKVNSMVDAHILLLYEEPDGPSVDEGTLTYKPNKTSSLTFGKTYIPFGTFETSLVSDPLTLELAETNETVFMYNFETGGFTLSAYAFNGDIDTDEAIAENDNTDIAYGINIGFGKEDAYSVNLGYVSNIADSDSLQEVGGTNIDSFVASAAVSFSMNIGNTTLNAEHIAVLDEFAAGDLGGVAAGAEPTASMIDVGFDLGRGVGFAVGYQVTDEALFLGLPETITLVAVSKELGDSASVSLEYKTADDYSVADGGTGESASQFTVQVAAEF
jgi:hypothetical protein